MAALTLQLAALAGLTPAFSAVNASDTLKVSQGEEREFLFVKNDDASPTTVTIAAVKTTANVKGVGALTIANKAIVVAAGAEAIIGPFPAAYVDTAGNVTITYSNVTSVTAAAVQLPAS